MRCPLIIGNWKLYGNNKIINELINDFSKAFNKSIKCNIVIAPPCIYLMKVKELLINNLVNHYNSAIFLGAQNTDINTIGAFTGDISPAMLKDIGVKYVIIGHSERRNFHNETDTFIAHKFITLKKQKLIPVLCIGETKEQYLNNQTQEICKKQIDVILQIGGINIFQDSVIAYEPIWAIGSGITPTPESVQKIHIFIRSYLSTYDYNIAKNIIIQYGGSINIDNIFGFSIQPDIDGVLLGASSLKINDFIYIINIFEKSKNIK